MAVAGGQRCSPGSADSVRRLAWFTLADYFRHLRGALIRSAGTCAAPPIAIRTGSQVPHQCYQCRYGDELSYRLGRVRKFVQRGMPDLVLGGA
jgi:hypothetical protein